MAVFRLLYRSLNSSDRIASEVFVQPCFRVDDTRLVFQVLLREVRSIVSNQAQVGGLLPAERAMVPFTETLNPWCVAAFVPCLAAFPDRLSMSESLRILRT